jgi:hypothetical protein
MLLPFREGGLGFYSCEAACDAAWVGAWNVAKVLVNRVVDLQDAGTDLAVCAPEVLECLQRMRDPSLGHKEKFLALIPADRSFFALKSYSGLQKMLTAAISKRAFNTLFHSFPEDTNAADLARLLSCSANHAQSGLAAYRRGTALTV